MEVFGGTCVRGLTDWAGGSEAEVGRSHGPQTAQERETFQRSICHFRPPFPTPASPAHVQSSPGGQLTQLGSCAHYLTGEGGPQDLCFPRGRLLPATTTTQSGREAVPQNKGKVPFKKDIDVNQPEKLQLFPINLYYTQRYLQKTVEMSKMNQSDSHH